VGVDDRAHARHNVSLMTVFRVYADAAGETHVGPVELPEVVNPGEGVQSVRGLLDIPASSVGIVELTDRLPGEELHPAPERRLLVLLSGAYEIATSSGESQVLRLGDCLFTDDVDGNGHYTRDVGDERVAMVAVRISSEWELPAH
jgi:hypothetical protein